MGQVLAIYFYFVHTNGLNNKVTLSKVFTPEPGIVANLGNSLGNSSKLLRNHYGTTSAYIKGERECIMLTIAKSFVRSKN